MFRDMKHNLVAKEAIPDTNVGSNTTTTGTIIDTQGYGALTFMIHGNTLTDGTFTPVVTAGNDSALADGAAAASTELLDGLADATLLSTDDNKCVTLGYVGGKRYVRLDVASTNVTTGGRIEAFALLGEPLDAPTATKN